MEGFDIVSYLMGRAAGGGGGMTSKSISGTGTTAVIGSGWTKTDVTEAAAAVVTLSAINITIKLIYSEYLYHSQNGEYTFYFGTANDAMESFECGILFDPAAQSFEVTEYMFNSGSGWDDMTDEVGDRTLTVIGGS